MAKLKAGINFLGTLAGVTAYTRKDLDDVIIHTKGGPTRKQIKKGKQFESVRINDQKTSVKIRVIREPKNHLNPPDYSSPQKNKTILYSYFQIFP